MTSALFYLQLTLNGLFNNFIKLIPPEITTFKKLNLIRVKEAVWLYSPLWPINGRTFAIF